jgi:hypothetical protein
LSKTLASEAGAPATNLPPLWVQVAGILPETHNGWLEDQAASAPTIFGGYRAIIGTIIVAWALLFIPLVLLGRKKRELETVPVAPEPTWADRLKPLVEQAAAGTLSADGKAALERLLIAHWRERLALDDAPNEQMIRRLREHTEAGRLLRALEDWLHRPPGSARPDIDDLLGAYRNPEVQPLEVRS